MNFLLKIMLFALPIAIPFLIFTGGLAYVGESMPLAEVLRLQSSDMPVLYRVKYGNRDQRYKRMAVDTFKPEVMIIGSSRVLQFRENLLTENPDAFYNAAAPAWQLEEIIRLLDNIDHKPKILILGIDDAWFNADYEGDPIVQPPTSDFARFFIVNRSVIQDVIADWRDEETESDIKTYQSQIEQYLARVEPGGSGGLALGGRAIIDGHGFRNDGSEQYGDFLVAQHLWQPNIRGLHMEWFEEGNEMYVRGSEVNPAAIEQMRYILDYARANDILLIGLYPPYVPTLWFEMTNSEEHTYIAKSTEQVEALFAEYDFPFFDYHSGTDVGAIDEDFFDGWHHSEKIATQIFINFVRYVPELEVYADIDALQSIVDNATDTFLVYPFGNN